MGMMTVHEAIRALKDQIGNEQNQQMSGNFDTKRALELLEFLQRELGREYRCNVDGEWPDDNLRGEEPFRQPEIHIADVFETLFWPIESLLSFGFGSDEPEPLAVAGAAIIRQTKREFDRLAEFLCEQLGGRICIERYVGSTGASAGRLVSARVKSKENSVSGKN